MKIPHLIFLFFLPFASLMAQSNDPETQPTPDTLETMLNEQEIIDLNSGRAVVEESTVMEMLDLVSTISMSKDVYLDIDTAVWNKYHFGRDEVPITMTASICSASRPWLTKPPSH